MRFKAGLSFGHFNENSRRKKLKLKSKKTQNSRKKLKDSIKLIKAQGASARTERKPFEPERFSKLGRTRIGLERSGCTEIQKQSCMQNQRIPESV